ncbi:MAG: SCP2 sterol-binding domain-containing protein [Deltaproteobacteria bacterium]|nr:SCP2 sterol-binding domain-containing protein [Deltaproteobacteria bacterium]MBW2020060.1 SCP2 sterol-binding domain-containing protein [Deltaproteobacteria bacterium]MBW2074872.1 SCP2 sterol-binding domain-containing protein [Deltaproteobacteria bacterium]
MGKEKVIPLHMIPDVGSEVVEVGNERFLQTNEAMFTFYKRTKGEHSPFFLALKERRIILGGRCPECKLVRVPPFELYCPECNFAELELIEMPDTGVMNSTPPITYFAHSLFQHQVPFGRGRVMLDGADTGLPIHVYTTKGVLTPRTFKKGTPVKIVFRDNRLGKPTDIFAVPLSELKAAQRKKKGLLESELDWATPKEPRLPKPTKKAKEALRSVIDQLQDLAARAAKSPRAQNDLAGWKRTVQVKTGGGPFFIEIARKRLKFQAGTAKKADFVMVVKDPKLFKDWINFKESLTNAIIAEKLWISKNVEFITVFKLDRIPRSIRRSKS